MSEPLNPTSLVQPGHHINLGQQLRDESELENLADDIRKVGDEHVKMPWRTGRPLRSSGQIQSSGLDAGCPIPLLDALDLKVVVPAAQQRQLDNELQRAALNDAISEGILDQAEREQQPLLEQEQWWEAEAAAEATPQSLQHKRGPFADGNQV